MLPTSHRLQRQGASAAPGLLAEAFSDFIAASKRLEDSYRDLQVEVQHLGRELAERNRALDQSRVENDAMRRLHEQILRSLPCGVLLVAAGGQIRFVNQEAIRLLHLPAEEMPTLAALLNARGLDLASMPACSTTDGLEQEIALAGLEGEQWLAVRRQCLSLTSLEPTSQEDAVFTLSDVSGRRRWETERDTARSAVALAEVASILAHEIRNPLASLELFTSLLEDCPDRIPEWITHLRAGLRSLSATVNNVLTLNAEAPPAAQRLHLDAELAAAVHFINPLATQAGIRLLLEPSSRPLAVTATAGALQQILLNLCSNAIRHTPAGGVVRLRPERRGSRVLVSVQDTGNGISPDHQKLLFHGRFSGSGSTSGLGLSVCHRLMQQHRGTISVQSALGQGSTFTLEFPAA